MLSLFVGGAGSGKSALAEQYVMALTGPRFYVATMEPYGKEAEERIQRHRELRKDKGFTTIECSRKMEGALPHLSPDSNVLLEDLTNLTANIFFKGRELSKNPGAEGKTEPGIPAIESVAALKAEQVWKELEILRSGCRHLTIVSGDLFSDGREFDEDTTAYLKCLALVNRRVAEAADTVREVVSGCENRLK